MKLSRFPLAIFIMTFVGLIVQGTFFSTLESPAPKKMSAARKSDPAAEKIMEAMREKAKLDDQLLATLHDEAASLSRGPSAPSTVKDRRAVPPPSIAAAPAPATFHEPAPPLPPKPTATPAPLPAPAGASVEPKLIASLIFSGVMLLASLWVILSKKYPDETAKWAYGTVGTLGGYWLAK